MKSNKGRKLLDIFRSKKCLELFLARNTFVFVALSFFASSTCHRRHEKEANEERHLLLSLHYIFSSEMFAPWIMDKSTNAKEAAISYFFALFITSISCLSVRLYLFLI